MLALFIIGFLIFISGIICMCADITYGSYHDGLHHPLYSIAGFFGLLIGFSLLITSSFESGKQKAYKDILIGKPNPYEMQIQYTVGKDTVNKDTLFVKIDK